MIDDLMLDNDPAAMVAWCRGSVDGETLGCSLVSEALHALVRGGNR